VTADSYLVVHWGPLDIGNPFLSKFYHFLRFETYQVHKSDSAILASNPGDFILVVDAHAHQLGSVLQIFGLRVLRQD
jgi:hypothetical protein